MKFRFPALPADAAGRSRLLNGAARLGVGVLSRVLMYLFLIASSFVLLYPVLYMLSMAFRPAADMSNPNVIWIPTALTLENIKGIWEYVQYPKLLGNTLLLCGVSSVLQVVVCCLVGYGFARFRFRGRGVLMGLLLLTIVLPPQATSVANYLQITSFDPLGVLWLLRQITGRQFVINLYDTPWAFWLPAGLGMGIRSGIFIIIYRQFFRSLPADLEDAGYVDGCGPLRTFRHIMLPNCRPAVVIVMLFSVVWYWNDTFYATSYFDTLRTISVKLAEMKADITRFLPDIAGSDPFASLVYLQAGVALSVIPMLLLYILCQRAFVESVERSGLVG